MSGPRGPDLIRKDLKVSVAPADPSHVGQPHTRTTKGTGKGTGGTGSRPPEGKEESAEPGEQGARPEAGPVEQA